MRASHLSSLLILLSSLLPPASVKGQGAHSYGYFDSITYQNYRQGNWSTLILNGKEALANGNDYYYLRMRLGAAYYELGNYRAANSNYEKALKFNSADENAMLGKYYSCMNLGNRDQASLATGKMSYEKKIALGIPVNSFFDFAYIESGYSPSSRQGHSSLALTGNDSIYGEENLQKDLFYSHVGGKIRIMPSLSVFAGYTLMNINTEKRVGYSSYMISRDSIQDMPYGKLYHYTFPRQLNDSVFPGKTRQSEFYLNADFLPISGWKITPAIHHFQVQYQKTTAAFQSGTASDTAFYLAFDNSYHLFEYQQSSYSIQQIDTSFHNYVLSLSICRDLQNFSVDIHGSKSDFNRMRQSQLGAGITWYPLGNANFYGTASATSVINEGRQRMVYEQSLGFRVLRNTWVTGFVTEGNLYLYNEKNAYVVYNQADPVTFRCGLDAVFLAGKHLELGLMYRFYRKEFQLLRYASATSGELGTVTVSVISKESYYNQTIIGGLKWKF